MERGPHYREAYRMNVSISGSNAYFNWGMFLETMVLNLTSRSEANVTANVTTNESEKDSSSFKDEAKWIIIQAIFTNLVWENIHIDYRKRKIIVFCYVIISVLASILSKILHFAILE